MAAAAPRISGKPVREPSARIRPGDVLSFAAGGAIRSIRILALPVRRGPPSEARDCYEEAAPPIPIDAAHR